MSPTDGRLGLSPSARRQFARLFPLGGEPLFPNLRTLTFTHDCAMDQVMGPEVTKITWFFEVGSPQSRYDLEELEWWMGA